MDTLLLVSTGSTYFSPIDLYDDVSIQIDIQEGDLSNFERRSNYSKSFRVPATDNNSKIFGYFYEVNGTNFNPYSALSCVVQINGNDIFKGTLRLNAVYINKDFVEYEVFILQELVDFNLSLGDISLKELDFTEYNHEINYDNITASWSATTGNTEGLFGGDIIYPLINYGLEYTAGSADFDYCIGSSPCFSNSGNALPENIWRPSIRIKRIIDKIVEYAGFTYSSDFMDSPYFKLLYMDLGYDDVLGVSSPGEGDNLNLFRVYNNDGTYISYSQMGNRTTIPFSTLDPDGYDYLNNYTTGDNSVFYGGDPTNYFSVPRNGTYGFEFRCSLTKVGTFNEDLKIQITARKATSVNGLEDGTIINSTTLDITDTEQQLLFLFTDTLTQDDYVALFVETIDTAGYNSAQTLILTAYDSDYPAPMFRCYSSPSIQLDFFETNKNIPDIKAIDFFRSIIKMFNLIFIVDPSKNIVIEPFDVYFQNSNRTKKDWTGKLDLSSSYTIKPFSFELPKEVKYQYQSGGDEVHSKYYEFQFNDIYGTRSLIKNSNVLKGEEILEAQFRPTPTICISGSDWIIIPEYYNLNDEALKVPTKTKPHLFFWLGNRYTYTSYSASTSSSWYLSSGGTAVEWTTYPCVSHLSQINSGQTQDEFSDLNFQPTWDFFATNNTYINQFTGNNVFVNFHKQLYDERYSNEARKLMGKFYLTPTDVGNIKITDKIFVKDSYYRIEKITGASLTEDKLTDVVLIKELNGGFYPKDNPVNNPSIPPNDPIP